MHVIAILFKLQVQWCARQFFIDVEGHAEESPVADALAELEKSASLFKVLGAYPKAIG